MHRLLPRTRRVAQQRHRTITVLRTVDELRAWRRNAQGTVGLVPTMGALHEGHARDRGGHALELAAEARDDAGPDRRHVMHECRDRVHRFQAALCVPRGLRCGKCGQGFTSRQPSKTVSRALRPRPLLAADESLLRQQRTDATRSVMPLQIFYYPHDSRRANAIDIYPPDI